MTNLISIHLVYFYIVLFFILMFLYCLYCMENCHWCFLLLLLFPLMHALNNLWPDWSFGEPHIFYVGLIHTYVIFLIKTIHLKWASEDLHENPPLKC